MGKGSDPIGFEFLACALGSGNVVLWEVMADSQAAGDLILIWWKWKLLSRVRLFVTLWTIQSMEFSRPEYWSGWPFSSPGDLPNPGIEPRFPHCRWILYQLNQNGSPRILEWLAYPFSSGSSQPRNQTGVSCLAGGFFTNWAVMEALVTWGHAAAAAKSLQSCLTLCDPIDGSLPGSSIHEIFQARVLEWGAIAFSERCTTRRSIILKI